jgi:uncharacterized protein YggU (UPF0235/DUF167 family)
VIQVLAGALGLPRQAIRIASGHTSSWKTIEVEGMTEAEVRRRLK